MQHPLTVLITPLLAVSGSKLQRVHSDLIDRFISEAAIQISAAENCCRMSDPHSIAVIKLIRCRGAAVDPLRMLDDDVVIS